MPQSSFIGLVLVMAAASSSTLTQQEVEIALDARKREILHYAGCSNEFDIHNRLFCLCPSCHQRPLLHRVVATTLTTVHRHKNDKPLPEVCKIFGDNHSVTLDDYFVLYRKYLQGCATEPGVLLACPHPAAAPVRQYVQHS